MIRLNPPIPLNTPKGKAFAYFLIDRSQDHNLEWICFINESGECWTFLNYEIHLEKNITMGINLENKGINK